MTDDDDVLRDAVWIEEGDENSRKIWRRHLNRQGGRTVVAVLVLLTIMGLKSSTGRPGQWVLDRFSMAVKTDFSSVFYGYINGPKILRLMSRARAWLASEYQVAGTALYQTAPSRPVFITPVAGARPSASPLNDPGVDFQAPPGSPVLAAAEGIARQSKQEPDGSMTLILEHGGQWKTIYRSCQAILVQPGERVAAGQTVALVGKAQPPSPSRLRFEIQGPQGLVDPRRYLGGNESI